MDLSERLKLLRQENGLSQEELADRLGVTRQAVSRWETGKVPNIDNLTALSELYEVTLDELMWDTPGNEKKRLPGEDETTEESINKKPSHKKVCVTILICIFGVVLLWGKLTKSMGMAKGAIVYAVFLLLLGGLIYVLYTLVMYLRKDNKK